MRVFRFSTVGLIGLLLNEFTLWFFTDIAGFFYIISGVISCIISATTNFFINDNWTFRERRRGSVFERLVKYYSISAVTALILISVLFILTSFLGIYYLISNLFGIFAGVFVAFLWSYSSNLRWTWSKEPIEIRKLPTKNPKVSIIIPTSNKEEAKGFVSGVSRVLEKNNIKGEVMVVDNLNSSVLNGFSEAKTDVIGVVYLFHSPEDVLELIKPIMNNESDLVIGSRYMDGSNLNCSFGNRVSHRFKSLLARGLVNVRDPLPDFFFFNKDVIRGVNLGCSIPSLEVLVKGKYGNVREIPYSLTCTGDGFTGPNIFSYLKDLVRVYWYKINE
jgi:putative flippase GtrA